jgi:hypothetical protein
MTSWQVERFALLHQTEDVVVRSTIGAFTGRPAGVRFARGQRRQCLRLRERPGAIREIPVEAILGLSEAPERVASR